MEADKKDEKSEAKRVRQERRRDKKLADLINDPRGKRLMSHFQLGLTEPMLMPLLGPGQRFELQYYNQEHEQVSNLVLPRLDYLSQDLGFLNSGEYEAIKSLTIEKQWRDSLFQSTIHAGKNEMNKYLRTLRPLLIDRGIYLYCITTPPSLVKTSVGTGKFEPDDLSGGRLLTALPTSVPFAQELGRTDEEIKSLAPHVAWLIPMLVVYRKVKASTDLIKTLDGWREHLSAQQIEKMYTAFVRSAPALINDEILELLFPRWVTRTDAEESGADDETSSTDDN